MPSDIIGVLLAALLHKEKQKVHDAERPVLFALASGRQGMDDNNLDERRAESEGNWHCEMVQ